MVYFYWVIDVSVSIIFFKQNTMNLWFYYGCRWQDIWQMDKVCKWCIIRNPYSILEAKSFMSNPLCTFKSYYMNWVIWLLLLTLTHCKQTPRICLSAVWVDWTPAVAAYGLTVLYLPYVWCFSKIPLECAAMVPNWVVCLSFESMCADM